MQMWVALDVAPAANRSGAVCLREGAAAAGVRVAAGRGPVGLLVPERAGRPWVDYANPFTIAACRDWPEWNATLPR